MNTITRCLAVAALAAACTPPDNASRRQEDVAAIAQATERWADAFVRGDIDAAMALVTPGATFAPPNEPVAAGAPAIEAWARTALGQVSFEEVSSTVDSVRVAGDWAVSRGHWAVTLSSQGSVVTDTSRYVVIWERGDDGPWKVAFDIWNFAQPQPTDE